MPATTDAVSSVSLPPAAAEDHGSGGRRKRKGRRRRAEQNISSSELWFRAHKLNGVTWKTEMVWGEQISVETASVCRGEGLSQI